MTKRFGILAIALVLAMLLCACAEMPQASSEIPQVSSEPTESSSVPTADPTTDLQEETPDYPRSTSFRTVDGLREFLLTEKETYGKGHYATLFQSVRSRGYFMKPVFTDDIQFRTKNDYKVAAAVTESGFEAPSVAYRLLYRDTDVLLYIHEIEESNSQTVQEHLYAHQSGKDLRDTDGYTLDTIKEKGIVEKNVITKSGNIKTWGKVYGSRYKIWFMLDDTHLVSVEWYTIDATAAEEFVSKLEFEKVELQPVTEAPEPTLPAGKVTPTPEAKTTPEAEKVTP